MAQRGGRPRTAPTVSVAIINLANSPPSSPVTTVTISPGSSRCQPGGGTSMAPK